MASFQDLLLGPIHVFVIQQFFGRKPAIRVRFMGHIRVYERIIVFKLVNLNLKILKLVKIEFKIEKNLLFLSTKTLHLLLNAIRFRCEL